MPTEIGVVAALRARRVAPVVAPDACSCSTGMTPRVESGIARWSR